MSLLYSSPSIEMNGCPINDENGDKITTLKIRSATDIESFLVKVAGNEDEVEIIMETSFQDADCWIKSVEDGSGFFTLRLLKDRKMALFPVNADSLKVVKIDETFDGSTQDLLGFRAFPFENEEVVVSEKRLSVTSKCRQGQASYLDRGLFEILRNLSLAKISKNDTNIVSIP